MRTRGREIGERVPKKCKGIYAEHAYTTFEAAVDEALHQSDAKVGKEGLTGMRMWSSVE